MIKFSNAFNQLLSKRFVSIITLLFCIASKSLLIFFYTYTGKDKIYSLSAGFNLMQGKGWTNSFYYLDDLGKEVLIPFCYWPPGYGLFSIPFLNIFGTNLYAGTVLFEITCFIIFILLCRAILRVQQLSVAWLNISTVLLSFCSHDFIENSLGTDLPALNFVLGFFYVSLLLWNCNDKRYSIFYGIASGLCLFGAGFTRFIYSPVCLLMAMLLLLICILKKNKTALSGFITSFIICFAGLIAVMLFHQAQCGSPFYTGINKTGFFWNNMAYWHPSVIASFINLNLVPVQLEKFTAVSYSSWLAFFSWGNWVFYLLLTAWGIIYLFRHSKTSSNRNYFFILTGFFLAGAIIGGLALLSFTHAAKYTLNGIPWTFIIEGRYHAFPVVFFQLVFLTITARRNDLFQFTKIAPAFISVLFILFIFNAIHQLYYTTKVAFRYRTMKTASAREQDYVYFENLLITAIRENPDREILVLSSDKYYPLLASMHGQKGIADPYTVNHHLPVIEKPTVLFTIIFDSEEKIYAGYVGRKDVSLINEIGGVKFYVQQLNPIQKK